MSFINLINRCDSLFTGYSKNNFTAKERKKKDHVTEGKPLLFKFKNPFFSIYVSVFFL